MSPAPECPPRSDRAGASIQCPQDEKMNQLVRDVGEILRVIKDDDFSGEPGLMSKVRKHGARLDSLELTRTKAYTIAGVAGSVVGFVGAGVFKIFSLMEKHAP